MKPTQKLYTLQLNFEERITGFIQNWFPDIPAEVIRYCWLGFYAVFGLCWLGGALLSVSAMALLTIGGHWELQRYFPEVPTHELTNPARIGQRVCFDISELHSSENLPAHNGKYSIPAIEYASRTAQHLTSGDIRLDLSHNNAFAYLYSKDDEEAAEWSQQLRHSLQSLGLTEDVIKHQIHLYEITYTPPHISGSFQVQGQLIRPNEVLVHRLELAPNRHEEEYISTTEIIAIIISILISIAFLILIGIWGWIWCLRSFLRILKNGAYQAPSSLLITALLQGSSLIVLSYLAGHILYQIFPHDTPLAPYHLYTSLQLILGGALILGLQLCSYRLRHPHP